MQYLRVLIAEAIDVLVAQQPKRRKTHHPALRGVPDNLALRAVALRLPASKSRQRVQQEALQQQLLHDALERGFQGERMWHFGQRGGARWRE